MTIVEPGDIFKLELRFNSLRWDTLKFPNWNRYQEIKYLDELQPA